MKNEYRIGIGIENHSSEGIGIGIRNGNYSFYWNRNRVKYPSSSPEALNIIGQQKFGFPVWSFVKVSDDSNIFMTSLSRCCGVTFDPHT